MAKSEAPKVDLFLKKGREFVSCSGEEKLGNLVNLVDNIFEPILVYDKDKFLGLISIERTIFNSRLDYLSKAENNLVKTIGIKSGDSLEKALRLMVNYDWYRVPELDEKGKVAGEINGKSVLRILFSEATFREIMILEAVIRKPKMAAENGRIQDGFGMLKSKDSFGLFLVNSEGRMTGMVTKDSLLKAFNQKVGSKNAIFVDEKIDRDDHFLKDYVKKIVPSLKAVVSEGKETVIKRLLESDFNTMVIVDRHDMPIGVLTTRDLIESVLVKDKTGFLKLKTRGFEGVKLKTMRQIDLLIGQLSDFVEKREKIKLIELSKKEARSAKEKIRQFELTLQVDFYSGLSLIANENSRDMIKGLRLAIDHIKSRFRKMVLD